MNNIQITVEDFEALKEEARASMRDGAPCDVINLAATSLLHERQWFYFAKFNNSESAKHSPLKPTARKS